MKNKIIIGVFVSIISVFVLNTVEVSAATLNEMKQNNYKKVMIYNPNNNTYTLYYGDYDWEITNNILNNTRGSRYNKCGAVDFNPILNPDERLGSITTGITSVNVSHCTIVVISGSLSVIGSGSYNAYDNENEYLESLEPKWYEALWDTFIDYMTNPVLGQWIDNLIHNIWGENNEGTIAENVDISAPTLAPTPTPIPYSTIVVPKTDIITGETVYETNYYYEDPDGTPTVAPNPPSNSPSNDGGGNGGMYSPVNGEPFSIPRLNWLTSVDIGNNNYDGIDSIYEGIGSINSIGSEYTDGLSAAQDATGTLPDSWLLLIGIAAAIPLIAGVISRFLS